MKDIDEDVDETYTVWKISREIVGRMVKTREIIGRFCETFTGVFS